MRVCFIIMSSYSLISVLSRNSNKLLRTKKSSYFFVNAFQSSPLFETLSRSPYHARLQLAEQRRGLKMDRLKDLSEGGRKRMDNNNSKDRISSLQMSASKVPDGIELIPMDSDEEGNEEENDDYYYYDEEADNDDENENETTEVKKKEIPVVSSETKKKQDSKPKEEQKEKEDLYEVSWMDKNKKFDEVTISASEVLNESVSRRKEFQRENAGDRSGFSDRRGDDRRNDLSSSRKTFREDFRGTRVFVQGIPPYVNWQQLKDHFRIAGEVVFASVSKDRVTQKSKGEGIVQFETVEEAQNAIKVMRDHPIDQDHALYVRQDLQEQNSEREYRGKQRDSRASQWRCANDESDSYLYENKEEQTIVLNIIKARDDARRRKNYPAADQMREQLKRDYNVHLDDRMKLWWRQDPSDSRKSPDKLNEMKGDGYWERGSSSSDKEEWKQIRTDFEKDSSVDPTLIQALLVQRDIARLERDFYTADTLLDQVVNAPQDSETGMNGGLIVRVHDDTRTWRVWSLANPQQKVGKTSYDESDSGYKRASSNSSKKGPVQQCMDLVRQFDPDKEDEIKMLLKKFPGREYNILKKLKQRYNNSEL